MTLSRELGVVDFKIHIDHIDNAGGRVWAIRVGKKLYVVNYITFQGISLRTAYRPLRQPRAWLGGRGHVRIFKEHGDEVWSASITGEAHVS